MIWYGINIVLQHEKTTHLWLEWELLNSYREMRRLCSLGCKSFNIALNLSIISVIIIIMYSTNVNVSIRIKRHEIYVVVSCECSFLILIIPSFLVIMQKRENDKKYVIVVLMDFVVIIIKQNGISLNWNTEKSLPSNVM